MASDESGNAAAAPLRPVRELTPREIVAGARFEGKLVVIGPTEYEMLLDIVDAARAACRGTAGDGTIKALGDAVREWEEVQNARP